MRCNRFDNTDEELESEEGRINYTKAAIMGHNIVEVHYIVSAIVKRADAEVDDHLENENRMESLSFDADSRRYLSSALHHITKKTLGYGKCMYFLLSLFLSFHSSQYTRPIRLLSERRKSILSLYTHTHTHTLDALHDGVRYVHDVIGVQDEPLSVFAASMLSEPK